MDWAGKKKKKFIDKFSKMLEDLGISEDSQQISTSPDRIEASFVTRNGRHFKINFFVDGNDLVYESVVKKAPTGDAEKALPFYQSLMTYNAAMANIDYSLLPIGEVWHLVIRGTKRYKDVDAGFIVKISDEYDVAIGEHLRNLEEFAEELNLEFTGNLANPIENMVHDIISNNN